MGPHIVDWQELPEKAELRVGELVVYLKGYANSFVHFKEAGEGENLIGLTLPDTTKYQKFDDHYEIAPKGE